MRSKPEKTPAPMDGRPNEKQGLIEANEPLMQEGMNWFVLRVASNKENSVQATLLRKVQIEGMTHLVGRILVPTEKTKTVKNGKQKITETKLYPGYVFVEMRLELDGRIPQDVFFLIKETTGVGDFVGTAGRPTPMKEHEIEKMLRDSASPRTSRWSNSLQQGRARHHQGRPLRQLRGHRRRALPREGQGSRPGHHLRPPGPHRPRRVADR
jgi:transcriptional antiterminator NusG